MKNQFLKNFMFCAAFLLCGQLAFGQVSIGKTVLFRYDFSFSMTLLKPTTKHELLGINGSHAIGVEKVLNRRYLLGFYGQTYRSAYGTYFKYRSLYNSNGLGVGIQFFKNEKAAVAPMGPWSQIRLFAYQRNITHKDWDGNLKTLTITDRKQNALDIKLGIGNQIFVAKQVLLSYGLEMSIPIYSAFTDDAYVPEMHHIDYGYFNRDRFRNLLMFRTGISYLLF